MNDIAILIPVYNNTKGLQHTLTSLSIAKGNFDTIIVDDGSFDPLSQNDLIFFGRPLILLRHSINQGITASLNDGLSYILQRSYKYIARLDAGDIAHPERFVRQQKLLDENETLGIVGCFVEFLDSQTKKLIKLYLPVLPDQIIKYAACKVPFIHPAVMIKTNIIKRIGKYDTKYHTAEDYELFYRMLVMGVQGYNIPEFLTTCELNLSGISATQRRRQLINILLIQKRYNRLNIRGLLGLARTLVLFLIPYRVIRFYRLNVDNSKM